MLSYKANLMYIILLTDPKYSNADKFANDSFENTLNTKYWYNKCEKITGNGR